MKGHVAAYFVAYSRETTGSVLPQGSCPVSFRTAGAPAFTPGLVACAGRRKRSAPPASLHPLPLTVVP
jgi:hypothetical protein